MKQRIEHLSLKKPRKVFYIIGMEKSYCFVQKVKKYIEDERLIEPKDKIVLGVSGGADSMALLECLLFLRKEYNLDMHVVTINHMLRPEAKEEAEYVEKVCIKENIDFTVKNINVKEYAAIEKLGTEEAGRKLRYEAFNEIADLLGEEAKIAVAHNANDNAETMLFNLFRGSGPTGIAGINPRRGKIIRPLLCVTRSEIEEYLDSLGVRFYTDASNLTDDYSRNVIRNHILKDAVTLINPNAVEHMSDAAKLLGEMNDYVKAEASKLFTDVLVKKEQGRVILKRNSLKNLSDYLVKLVILNAINKVVPNARDIQNTHVEGILANIRKTGTYESNLPYGMKVLCEGDCIIFSTIIKEAINTEIPLEITYEKKSVDIPGYGRFTWWIQSVDEEFEVSKKRYTKCFDYDKITKPLVLRGSLPNDYLVIDDKNNKKKLTDYFTNEKIPRDERNQLFLLTEENHVLWVVGYRIGEDTKVSKNTKTVLTVQFSMEEGSDE